LPLSYLVRAPKMPAMRVIDPQTEGALRAFLARLPADIAVERALLYGSRARGDYKPESDADLALVLKEQADDWRLLWDLSGLAYDVYLKTGIMIQPVPISSGDWANPNRFARPSFLRNITREGIPL
jgi:predicted nucleotidyltransferase